MTLFQEWKSKAAKLRRADPTSLFPGSYFKKHRRVEVPTENGEGKDVVLEAEVTGRRGNIKGRVLAVCITPFGDLDLRRGDDMSGEGGKIPRKFWEVGSSTDDEEGLIRNVHPGDGRIPNNFYVHRYMGDTADSCGSVPLPTESQLTYAKDGQLTEVELRYFQCHSPDGVREGHREFERALIEDMCVLTARDKALARLIEHEGLKPDSKRFCMSAFRLFPMLYDGLGTDLIEARNGKQIVTEVDPWFPSVATPKTLARIVRGEIERIGKESSGAPFDWESFVFKELEHAR